MLTLNRSGFPIVEVPLADADDLARAGRFLLDRGIYVTLAFYPGVPREEVGFRIQVTRVGAPRGKGGDGDNAAIRRSERGRPAAAAGRAQSARPVPAAVTVRCLEPLAPVFLGLHGVMVLVNLGGEPWQFAAVGLVLLLGLVGLGGRGPAWMVPVRGWPSWSWGWPSRPAPAGPVAGSWPGRSCWSRCTRWPCRDRPGW